MKKFYLFMLLFCIQNTMYAQVPVSQNITFRDSLQFSGNSSIASVWGYVDETGIEYALVGTNTGMTVVNVNDPTNIFKVASVSASPVVNSLWREVKAYKNYAYTVTEGGGGLMITDLSPLPQSNVLPNTFFQFSTVGRAHTLFIDEKGILYLFGCNAAISNGAMMYDLDSIPGTPVYLGSYTYANGSYIHDGYVRNDTLYAGHIQNGFFSVVDVRNKQNPVTLATQPTPNLFTHNTWLSADSKTLFTTDEKDFSYLAAYDISDLSNITEVDRVHVPYGDSISIPHNVYVKNQFAITAWYKEGVIVHDVTNPKQLVQVGYFDCDQMTSGGLYNKYRGAWGAYPFLPSGNILISDILNGLFVVTPTYLPAAYLKGKVTDVSGNAIGGAIVEITGVSPISRVLTDNSGNYMIGIATAGSYTINYSRTGYASQNLPKGLTNGNTAMQNVVLGSVSAQDYAFVDANLQPNVGRAATLYYNLYSAMQPAKVVVTDVSGKIVLEQPLDANQNKVDLQLNTAQGIYFVQIQQQNRKNSPLKGVKI